MIPSEILSQRIFQCSSADEVVKRAEELWQKGMCITGLAHGPGYIDDIYFVVASKVPTWENQQIIRGATFPKDDVTVSMAFGRSITCMINNRSEWLIVMTRVPETAGNLFLGGASMYQKWLSVKGKDSLFSNLNEKCTDKKVVTKVCSKPPFYEYCIVALTTYQNAISQKRYFMKDRFLIKDAEHQCVGGKYIVDICSVDDGAYIIADDRTGWDKCKVIKDESLRELLDKIKLYWDRGYKVTSVAKCGYDWIAVLGQK